MNDASVCLTCKNQFGGKMPGHHYGSNWEWVPCQTCQGTGRPPPDPRVVHASNRGRIRLKDGRHGFLLFFPREGHRQHPFAKVYAMGRYQRIHINEIEEFIVEEECTISLPT